MHLRPTTSAAGLLLGGFLLLASASPAAAVCDAYSGNCSPEPSVAPSVVNSPSPSTEVLPASNDRPAANEGATLPFTGGELVLMTALGAGALAGGTALVVAGRRRKPGTAA